MSDTLSKVIVVVVNLIFLIFGIAILALGIVFKSSWDDVREAFVDKSKDHDFNLQSAGDTLGWAGIIFGAFMVIVSVMGCIGGWCRVKFLLVIYAIIVLIILIAQIAIVAFVAIKGNEAEDILVDAMKDSLEGYKEDSTDDVYNGWNALFSTVECCGVVDYTKEFNSTIFSSHRQPDQKKPGGPVIPVACCKNFDYEASLTDDVFKNKDVDKCLTAPTKDVAYVNGCETKIKDMILDNKGILIGVGITIIVIEVLVVILAFILCCRDDD